MELPSTKLKSRSVVNVGRSVRKKHLRVKKSSPKSLALTVQQHKNKLSDKKAAKLVTWKQWKHPKNSGKNQWWKMKTPEKTIMKNLIFSGAFYRTVLPDIWHNLLLSRESAVSLGVGSSSLKVAGPPNEVRNTVPVHLFVWITQCSAKDINR